MSRLILEEVLKEKKIPERFVTDHEEYMVLFMPLLDEKEEYTYGVNGDEHDASRQITFELEDFCGPKMERIHKNVFRINTPHGILELKYDKGSRIVLISAGASERDEFSYHLNGTLLCEARRTLEGHVCTVYDLQGHAVDSVDHLEGKQVRTVFIGGEKYSVKEIDCEGMFVSGSIEALKPPVPKTSDSILREFFRQIIPSASRESVAS